MHLDGIVFGAAFIDAARWCVSFESFLPAAFTERGCCRVVFFAAAAPDGQFVSCDSSLKSLSAPNRVSRMELRRQIPFNQSLEVSLRSPPCGWQARLIGLQVSLSPSDAASKKPPSSQEQDHHQSVSRQRGPESLGGTRNFRRPRPTRALPPTSIPLEFFCFSRHPLHSCP